VEADSAHVADDLAGRLLKREILATLAASTWAHVQAPPHAGLARAGHARQQDAAPAVVTRTTEHHVEAFDAGRDSLIRCLVIELYRGDWPDRDAVLVDEKRILIGSVGGTAILDDAHPPGGD